MYYPQEVLDEVLAKTDIVEVVSSHVHLKKRGKDYVGLCPFHNEKTPSFNVIPAKNMYYCFGCGAAGSPLTFLMKYNNSSFAEALGELADRAGVTLPAPNMSEETKKRERHRQELLAVNKEAAVYYYRMLRSARGARGMKYFADRGLSPETMKAFGLGFADGYRSDLTAYLRKKGFSDELILESDLAVFNEKQGIHDRFWNRVMFPIQDTGGKVIGFGGRVLGDAKPKYINSSDTKIFDKGRNLYALNLARRSRKDHLILCEGYMDVIAMHQAGFTEAVASLGTAFTPGQAALLKRCTGKILLAYDSDGAGVRAALRNIGILRDGGLESAVIDLSPHKDPDEFIRAEGKDAFQERIDQAENSFFYELRMLEKRYRMDDPASRTAFHREIAKKLCSFSDEIERDNYIAAAADKYFIRKEGLRRLVAQYGSASSGPNQYSGGSKPAFRYDTNVFPNRSRADSLETSVTEAEKEISDSVTGGSKALTSAVEKSDAGRGAALPSAVEKSDAGRTAAPPSAGGNSGIRRPGAAKRSLSKAGKTLLERQAILLSWASEDPKVLDQMMKVLSPEDFSGELFVRTAQLLWKQAQENKTRGGLTENSIQTAGIISSFDTSRQQEAVAKILNMPFNLFEGEGQGEGREGGGDSGPEKEREREKMFRELVCAVKEEAVRKMSSGPDGGGAMLQDFLTAKKELLALKSMRFRL